MAELIASYVLLQLHFIGYLSHLCEHEESVHKDKLTQISGHVPTIHVHVPYYATITSSSVPGFIPS